MWWPAARVERDVLGCGPSTRIRLSADVLAAAEAVVAAQRRAARTAEAPVPIGMVQLPKSEEDDAIGRLMPLVAAASAAAAAAAAAPLWRIGTVGTVRPRGISSHGSESDDGGPDSGARRFLPGPFTPPPAAALSPGESPWSGSDGDGGDPSAAASVPGAAPPPRNHAAGHGGGPASPRGASESLAARTHSPDGGSGAAADEDALLAMALQAAEEGEEGGEGVAGMGGMLLEEGGEGGEEEEEAWLRAAIAASLVATAALGSGNGGEGGDATAAMDVDAGGDGSTG
jgi:hypothetical protein